MFLSQAFDIANKLISAEKQTPVLKPQSPESLRQTIDLAIEKTGISEADFFQNLEKIVMTSPRTASNSFFNQLFVGRNEIALSGEILASVLNNSMSTYKVGGVQILVEKEVVAQMLQKIGFENGEGIFAPGGSMTNMMAMIIARNEKMKNLRNEGFDGKKHIIYTSEDSHYSIVKNAGMIGLGRHNVRLIPCDGLGKMDTEKLRAQIIEDMCEKYVPVMINATAGTTVLGAFDPLEEIANIAQEFNIWLHIDGALGGSVSLSSQYKHLLKGTEKADSFSWNVHKMMCVPLSASVILLKNKGLLKKHFAEDARYLFQQDEDDLNLGLGSIQCARRNDALKVWAAWKFYGHEGYEKRINHLFELAEYATEIIESETDFTLAQVPESVTVCFQVKGFSSEAICRLLDEKGLAKVSHGTVRGENYIRLACVNPDLSKEDIAIFFQKIKNLVAELESKEKDTLILA